MKLLVHVSDIASWNIAIGNAMNAKKSLDNSEVEIIANSTAVAILKDKVAQNFDIKEKLELLASKGIKIKACKNALNKFDLTKNDILSVVEIVDAAIIEIVERQNDGFAYVKA